jgi:hypothetical protein
MVGVCIDILGKQLADTPENMAKEEVQAGIDIADAHPSSG